jgi:hypothetical protein
MLNSTATIKSTLVALFISIGASSALSIDFLAATSGVSDAASVLVWLEGDDSSDLVGGSSLPRAVLGRLEAIVAGTYAVFCPKWSKFRVLELARPDFVVRM